MSKCKHCGLEILDATDKCPLCSGILEGEKNPGHTYPDVISSVKKAGFLYRLFCFIAIVVASASIVINVKFTPTLHWGEIVTFALAYGLFLLYIILKDNLGYRLRIIFLVVGAVILVIGIDAMLGYSGWSISYVLPSGILFMDLAFAILMIINRRNWQSYLIIQAAMILVGILPLVLIHMGYVAKPLMSEIAFAVTVFIFVGGMVLGGHTAINEMKRRFHI